MVQKTFTKTAATLMAALLFSACADKSEYTHAIPADAEAVVSIDLAKLVEKAGINDKENEAAKTQLTEAMKSKLSGKTYEQVSRIMEDPSASGLDLKKPVYIVKTSGIEAPMLVAKVGSSADCGKTFRLLFENQQDVQTEETDGCTLIGDGSGLVAYTDQTLIIASPSKGMPADSLTPLATKLLRQKAEESIANVPGFGKMAKSNADIAFYVTGGAMIKSLESLPMRRLSPIGAVASLQRDLYEKIYGIGELTFEDGKAVLKYTCDSEDKATLEKIDRYNQATPTLDGSFHRYFPASTLLYTSVGLDGGKLLEIAKETLGTEADALGQHPVAGPLVRAIEGDVSFGITQMTMSQQPTLVMYAKVNDKEVLQKIMNNPAGLGLPKGMGVLTLGENRYALHYAKNAVYFGIKGDMLYATTDEALSKTIGEKPKESITGTDYAREMKGQNGFAAINAKAIGELPVMQLLAMTSQGRAACDALSRIAYLSLRSKGREAEISLVMADPKANSLQQLIAIGRQAAGQ